MIVELARSIHFQAAHTLPRTPVGHKCRRVHGHTYKLTIWLRGEPRPDGFIVDNHHVDTVLQAVHRQCDHRLLNEADIPDFVKSNPTAENIVIWVWEMAKGSGVGEWLHRVELREGQNSIFATEGP